MTRDARGCFGRHALCEGALDDTRLAKDERPGTLDTPHAAAEGLLEDALDRREAGRAGDEGLITRV